MTNKEAAKTLLTGMYRSTYGFVAVSKMVEDDFLYAIGIAVSVLMKQEEEGKHLCKCQTNS